MHDDGQAAVAGPEQLAVRPGSKWLEPQEDHAADAV